MSPISMIILGIDPGLRTTGFGLIEKQGQQFFYLASGTIKTVDGTLPDRLKTIFTGVEEIIARYQPDCASSKKCSSTSIRNQRYY
jgi:crossover junction endodeoxyribonuclease RuvC